MESRQGELRTCFIIAPLSVDTLPLRVALVERHVKPIDASEALIGSFAQRARLGAIKDVDFVCAVIQAGPADATVFYELGIAAGVEKPSLLFVAPKAELPVALRNQPYARASLTDADALQFHLDAFLQNLDKLSGHQEDLSRTTTARTNPKEISLVQDRLLTSKAQNIALQGLELERIVADAFEAGGYITEVSPMSIKGAPQADLAVWVDELQDIVGNPLIVEVTPSRKSLRTKAQHLRAILREFQSPLGLLVTWDPKDSMQFLEEPVGPIVVTMGAHELVDAIARGDFARTLLDKRNIAAHNAA